MSSFPTQEGSIAILATTMLNGVGAHIADFPNIDELALTDAIATYNTKKTAQIEAVSSAKIATEAKNAALDELIDLMKEDLKTAEVDTNDDPEKLSYIGWGPKDAKTPIQIPNAPIGLVAFFNGTGQLNLTWKKSAYDRNKPVYSYIVQRRDQLTEGSEFGEWFMVDMVYKNETTLLGQPSNKDMEYRIIASNPVGQSIESNAVLVVLK